MPYARIQVAKRSSGSYGLSEIEVQLQLADLAYPESNPVIQLKNFDVRIRQERFGKSSAIQQSAGVSPATTLTSIYGSATITLELLMPIANLHMIQASKINKPSFHFILSLQVLVVRSRSRSTFRRKSQRLQTLLIQSSANSRTSRTMEHSEASFPHL